MQRIYSESYKIVSKFINKKNIEEYELEIRFGKTINKRFNPNIGNVFYDIYDLVKENEVVENAYIHDFIYNEGTERKIYKMNEIMINNTSDPITNKDICNTIKLKKNKLKKFTFNYVRLSFNKENIIDFSTENLPVILLRKKYRLGIMLGDIFRFDFTIINNNEYSVEIEILLPNINNIQHFEIEFKKLNELLSPIVKKMI